MQLRFLDFDFSGDADGHGSFDAMAAAGAQQLAVLQAEVVQVLDWAHRQFGAPAPAEDGGEWDYELQGVQELVTPLAASFDAAGPGLVLQPQGAGTVRLTLTLTVGGSEQFCAAFRAAFGVD
jgi:hypothetical protein